VADRDHDRVRVFDREGKPLYDWGSGRLHAPDGFALAPDGSFAVACEGLEDRLQLFGPEDEASRKLQQSAGSSPESFGGGIAARGKLCVVLEPAVPCGLALDTSGSAALLLARFGGADTKLAALALPAGVALDEQQRAWICDPVLRRLVIIALDRKADAPLAPDPALPRFFRSVNFDGSDGGEPVAVALDSAGQAYVLEARGGLLVLQPDFDKGAQSHPLPGKSIMSPSGIAVSPDGARILVADPGAHALHVLQAPEKSWKTIVLKADGLEPRPSGVAIAKDGSVFVTDEQRDEVVKLSPALERVASWGKKGAGPLEFSKPRALAIDDQGQLWVLDLGNRRVQVLTQEGAFVRSFDAPSLAPK
jgi:sugar lactone lactonase YvrE